MPKRSSKLPTDPNQLGKRIIDIATAQPDSASKPKNAAAMELGRLGGLKGGAARAKSLSPEKRKEIAEKAAAARWKSK